MSIHLPVLHRLEVKSFALYPDRGEASGITHDFESGVTLIVGTNGLGKTTLINIILRCLTGPFNPPKNEGVVVSARQVEATWRERKTYFAKRVGDQAARAIATLAFSVGDTRFSITRALRDTRLTLMSVNDENVVPGPASASLTGEAAEEAFRAKFAAAIGASSFVAALQIVRGLVFVDENRRALLWDVQSQSEMLRDLLIGAEGAGALRDNLSKFMSADSRERNLRWQANSLSNTLANLRSAQRHAGPLSDQLSVILQTIRADEDRKSDLEQLLEDSEAEVRRLRLDVERTRLLREDLRGEVEEIKLSRASRLFPDLDDTGRYILSRFYSGQTCLACGADITEHLLELDSALAAGTCLVCNSPAAKQQPRPGAAKVADRSELVEKEYRSKRQQLDSLSAQLSAMEEALSLAEASLREVTDDLSHLSNTLARAKTDARVLQAKLPPDDAQVRAAQNEFDGLSKSVNSMAAERKRFADDYKVLLVELRDAASAKQEMIVSAFSLYVREFLAEDAMLSYSPREQRIGQTGEKFELPRFKFDMSSAAYEGKVGRETVDDVSESQREFIDLAYRMALIDACVDGPAALIMETPEASLDGVFMQQAGRMLNAYGARPDRQLIVTSNLSSAGMIEALMAGAEDVERRVINLFDLASPTKAVLRYRTEYADLLDKTLGHGQAQSSGEGAS